MEVAAVKTGLSGSSGGRPHEMIGFLGGGGAFGRGGRFGPATIVIRGQLASHRLEKSILDASSCAPVSGAPPHIHDPTMVVAVRGVGCGGTIRFNEQASRRGG